MKKILLIFPLLLFINGCSQNKSPPLKGTREDLVLINKKLIRPNIKIIDKKISLSTPIINNQWKIPGNRGSLNSNHQPIKLVTKEKITLKWKSSIGAGNNNKLKILHGPIVANGKIFTMDANGRICAFTFNNGKKIWSVNSNINNNANFSGGITYSNGYILATTANAQIMKINAQTGSIKQVYTLNASGRSYPIVYGKNLYTININNELQAINDENNTHIWALNSISESLNLLGNSAPIVQDNILIAGFASGEIKAIHPLTGAIIWSKSISGNLTNNIFDCVDQIQADPITYGDKVYIATTQGQIKCMGINSGKKLWAKNIGTSHMPIISNGLLFILSANNDLVCMNAQNGDIYWIKTLAQNVVWHAPILVNNDILLTNSNGDFLSFSSENGNAKKILATGEKISHTPIIIQNTIIVLNKNGYLIAYE